MTLPKTAGRLAAAPILLAGVSAPAAHAQEEDAPRRTRIALGPQLVPSYPGSDAFVVRPLIDVARSRGDAPFGFEAPDESFGFPLWEEAGFAIGPALDLEGSRTAGDVGAELPKVGFTVELGGFVEYRMSEAFRLRAEARKGLGGHKGWIGAIGGDYVARDDDDWLVSIGPRLTLADDRYQDAYFSVAPADAAASGVPAYAADGGLQAIGATAGFIRQLTPRWGLYGYAKYDRLVADPAESPIVRLFGSRDQLAGGVALTYTLGDGVD